jgi:hypothetical protein
MTAERLLPIGVVAALAVAVGLRLAPLFGDFPTGDGGLFWVMAGELRDNGFAPPMTTGYNHAGIPWVYPPIGLYLAALAGAGLEAFRVLPVLISIATIPAVWLVARPLVGERAALVATIAYGLSSIAYVGLVAGGGVTRGPGVLLGLLTLWAMLRRHAVLAGVLGGLVILAHPIAAFYTGLSAAVLWATRGAKPVRMIYAPFISLLIGAIWFGPMIARHGWEILLAGSGSRSIDLLANLMALIGGAINPPNLAFTIGAVGIVVAASRRRWDLLAWLAVTALGAAVVDRWAVIPLAVLAGLAVDAALDGLPQLRSVALVAVAAAVTFIGVALGDRPESLTGGERDLASWAAEETPEDATFAVIGYRFDAGMVDWFPALSQRHNVTTWQGTEWIADGYTRPQAVEIGSCRELACVPDVDFVVLRPGCCEDLAAELSLVRTGVYRR